MIDDDHVAAPAVAATMPTTVLPATAEVFLKPGELWFGEGPVVVRTVLGSCVAITLWHPARRLGGMCHFMLPSRPSCSDSPPDGRYANEAMELLLGHMQRHGTRASDYEAKLFGGGRMFPNIPCSRSSQCQRGVQDANVDIARALVAEHRLRLRGEHLGGDGHREVLFDVATGAVWIRHTPRTTRVECSVDASPR